MVWTSVDKCTTIPYLLHHTSRCTYIISPPYHLSFFFKGLLKKIFSIFYYNLLFYIPSVQTRVRPVAGILFINAIPTYLIPTDTSKRLFSFFSSPYIATY